MSVYKNIKWCNTVACFVILLAILVFIPGITARTRSSDLEYFKLVQPPGIRGEHLLYITFDHEIYKFSEPDYSDVRIFDSHGNDIPRIVQEFDYKTGRVPAGVNISEDVQGRQTIIDIEMNREPVTSFTFDTPSVDFERSVRVMIPGIDEYEVLAASDIYHRSNEDGLDSLMSVSFDEQRSMIFRITIDNEEQPPLEIGSIQYSCPVHRLIYQGLEGESYQLFWGSSVVGPPSYSVSDIENLVSSGEPMRRARVGRGFANPQYAPGQHSDVEQDTGSSLLPAALFLVIILVLVFVFLKSGRHKDTK